MEALLHHLRAAYVHILANERPEAEHQIRAALQLIDAAGPNSPLRVIRGQVAAAGYDVTRVDSHLDLATIALNRALGFLAQEPHEDE